MTLERSLKAGPRGEKTRVVVLYWPPGIFHVTIDNFGEVDKYTVVWYPPPGTPPDDGPGDNPGGGEPGQPDIPKIGTISLPHTPRMDFPFVRQQLVEIANSPWHDSGPVQLDVWMHTNDEADDALADIAGFGSGDTQSDGTRWDPLTTATVSRLQASGAILGSIGGSGTHGGQESASNYKALNSSLQYQNGYGISPANAPAMQQARREGYGSVTGGKPPSTSGDTKSPVGAGKVPDPSGGNASKGGPVSSGPNVGPQPQQPAGGSTASQLRPEQWSHSQQNSTPAPGGYYYPKGSPNPTYYRGDYNSLPATPPSGVRQ